MPYMPKDCGCWHHHCLTFTNTNSARQELRFKQLKAQLDGSTQELDKKIDANAETAHEELITASGTLAGAINDTNEALQQEIDDRTEAVKHAKEEAEAKAEAELRDAKIELSGRITDVENDSQTRDTELRESINALDTKFGNKLDTEIGKLDRKIDGEIRDRKAGDEALSDRINELKADAATKGELKTVKEKLESDMIRQYSAIQEEIADSETLGKDVIVTKTVGYIAEGTKLKKEENIKDIIANMLHRSGVKSAPVYFYCGPDISPVMPGLKEFRPVQHGKDVWKQETVDLDTAAAGVTHIFRVDDEPCYFAFAYPMSLGMQLGSSIGELRSIRRGHEAMGSNRNDLAVGGFHTQLCPINDGSSGRRGEKYWLYIFGDDEPELTTEGFMYTFKWN